MYGTCLDHSRSAHEAWSLCSLLPCRESSSNSGPLEVPWGSDPLERFGGFPKLQVRPTDAFTSSLAPNGTVSWQTLLADSSSAYGGKVEARLKIAFPAVDWPSLHLAYGWAAYQYQAWTRGNVYVEGDACYAYVMHVYGALEFYVDQVLYFGGDLYGFGRASVPVRLCPGHHTIDIRLVRDARAMGGAVVDPAIDILCSIRIATTPLSVVERSLLMADIIHDNFVSPYASVAVRNDGLQDIQVHEVTCAGHGFDIRLLNQQHIAVAPGQTRPIAFTIRSRGRPHTQVDVLIKYSQSGNKVKHNLTFSHEPRSRTTSDSTLR